MAINNINSLSLDPSGGFPASATEYVGTNQVTTSTSYTDLATAGPAVTITTGTKALIIITANQFNDTANGYSDMSFAVSGATTVAASSDRSLVLRASANATLRPSHSVLMTGLTAGSNTFTAKYSRQDAVGNAYFNYRRISVIDMGS